MITRILLVAVAASLFAAAAQAAPPTPTVSSIEIAAGSTLTVGGTVTFNTIVEKLAGWEYPMIAVSCYQDVNQDNIVDTNLLGPDIVFAWLDRPDAAFLLGEYSSIWTLGGPWNPAGGGPASCRADLDAYGWKGGKESTRVRASVTFAAS